MNPEFVAKQVKKTIRDFISAAVSNESPMALLVTGAQGIGKSTAVAEALAGGVAAGHVVWWCVPTLAKAEEQLKEYTSLANDKPSPLPAYVVRGRSAPNVNDPTVKMCQRDAIANLVAESGGDVRHTVCERCPLSKGCPYLEQYNLGECNEGLFLMAHQYLRTSRCPAPDPDIVIIDEMIALKMLDRTTLSIEALRNVMEIVPELQSLIDFTIDNALKVPRLSAFNGLDTYLESAERRLSQCYRQMIEEVISTTEDPITLKTSLKRISSIGLRQTAALFRLIRLECKHGQTRHRLNGLVHDQTTDEIRLSLLSQIPDAVHSAPLLLLDGTGSLPLNEIAFRRSIDRIEFSAARKAEIIQVRTRYFSNHSLLTAKDAPETRRQVSALLRRLRSETKSIVVFSNKSVEDALRTDPSLANISTGHYQLLRGLNHWKEYNTGVILGRDQPSVHDLERQARAFATDCAEAFQSLIDPQTGIGRLKERTGYHALKDGTAISELVEDHPDWIASEVLKQIREAELVQALDRLRPVWNECTIYVLTSIPLSPFDVVVDRLVLWHKLSDHNNRLRQVYEKFGFLPQSGTDLYRLAGSDYFKNENAAGMVLKRGISGSTFPINILLGKTTLKSARVVEYKKSGKGQGWTLAVLDHRHHEDPVSVISKLLGCEVEVRPAEPRAKLVKTFIQGTVGGMEYTEAVILAEAA